MFAQVQPKISSRIIEKRCIADEPFFVNPPVLRFSFELAFLIKWSYLSGLSQVLKAAKSSKLPLMTASLDLPQIHGTPSRAVNGYIESFSGREFLGEPLGKKRKPQGLKR
ncbi:MAG: hypothetical protein J7641_08075 [Cyanobacteria bacterium SID2]|nr:hypothetical protein [Cyanobacteria bacterium SID2]MBP0005013.1 hypothetical protein [Cyanobacteria bacterium SBC]